MSTPQNQAQKPDRSALDTHQASHQMAQQAAQGHAKAQGMYGDSLTKLHQSISQMLAQQQGMQQPQQDASQQDPYANMPDPGQWVQDDPHGAAQYADLILQRFAELANQMAQPAGSPDMGVGAGPAVGGQSTGAY